jgi:cytochrome c biogenesis protein CcdA
MRKIFFLFFFIAISSISAFSEDKILVTLFYSEHCKVCFKIKEEIIPSLKEEYKDSIKWRYLDTANPRHLSSLHAVTIKFGRPKPYVPSIHVGDSLLVGYKEIKGNLKKELARAVQRKKSAPLEYARTDLLDVFKGISVLTVIGSGLIDGINPCAFAVVVFFMSFLAVYGYRKREIIYVGIFYCLAVFVTYLLIGLGFFGFLYQFANVYLFIKAFYYFIAAFCFLMCVLSVYDYFRFTKTGRAEDSLLQLPAFLKKRINIVIGSGLRDKKEASVFSLALTSFVVGVLVSLLEAVCTGQVYLPTIVFILKNTDLKLRAAGYLLLYNFMFILPLIAVFLLSLAGVRSSVFNEALKKNLGAIKMLMAVVFFVLGALILAMTLPDTFFINIYDFVSRLFVSS